MIAIKSLIFVKQNFSGYFLHSVPNHEWISNVHKKNNSSWYWYAVKVGGNHIFYKIINIQSYSF